MSVKVVEVMGFAVEDRRFSKWLWVKSVDQSTSLRYFLTEDEVFFGKTLNISARCLILLMRTWVNAASAVIFFEQRLLPIATSLPVTRFEPSLVHIERVVKKRK